MAVVRICQVLQSKGSKPSTALIRAGLGSPVPLPKIIKGLQYWQADPALKMPQTEHSNTASTAVIDAQSQQTLLKRVDALEDALKALQTEVAALKRQ
jgi:hypothetical protein